MTYWVSLATHGPRIDESLRDTIETVFRFDPKPERILIAVKGEDDRQAVRKLLAPWPELGFVSVADTGCRGSGKKIWPALELRERTGADAAILTIDDDCYYQPDLPKVLARGARENPGCLVAMTAWTVGSSRWEPDRGFIYGMGCVTAGTGDGPNGAAGVWYAPGLPLDWRRLLAWSLDPRTEMSDDIFVAGECKRAGIRVVAVSNLYRFGMRPLEGPHANDGGALYRSEELRRRAKNGFILTGLLACPPELRGTESDPSTAPGGEAVLA